MSEVYILTIESFDSEKNFLLKSLLSPERRERLSRYLRKEDAYRCLMGGLLVRYVLTEKYRIANEELEFGTEEKGKPYLQKPGGACFNISHSDHLVGAVFDTEVCGMDVECDNSITIESLSQIAKYFHPREREFIDGAADDGEKKDRFCRLWTLKEAYLKYLGTGLSKALSSFAFQLQIPEGKAVLTDSGVHKEVVFSSFTYGNGYVSIAARREPQLKFCTDNELAEWVRASGYFES